MTTAERPDTHWSDSTHDLTLTQHIWTTELTSWQPDTPASSQPTPVLCWHWNRVYANGQGDSGWAGTNGRVLILTVNILQQLHFSIYFTEYLLPGQAVFPLVKYRLAVLPGPYCWPLRRPDKSSKPPACDRASLGSEPSQPTKYIYFIIQFRQHNIKVKVTATCFDLTSHLQAYLRTITNYNMPVHIWDPRWLTMCVGIRI